MYHLSRPVRALWIEMDMLEMSPNFNRSRPVRALWIEMPVYKPQERGYHVEAREGLVD